MLPFATSKTIQETTGTTLNYKLPSENGPFNLAVISLIHMLVCKINEKRYLNKMKYLWQNKNP